VRRLALIAGCAALLLQSAAHAEEPRGFVGGSWRAILKAHAGRPTVVHFWGLTCGPCRVEMASWGALLARRHDVDFVTVDTDMVPTVPGQAASFLATSGIPAGEAWRFDDGFAEKLYFQVDPKWQGEIPMTVLVSRDGRIERVTGAADPKVIATWLDHQATTPR
jgi:thiol-disulfide isomerase/thioredoxin